MQDRLFEVAKSYVGLKEIKGNDYNPIITNWLKICIPNKYLTAAKSDETSWCAAFIHGCFVEAFGWDAHKRLVLDYGGNSLAKSFKNLRAYPQWQVISDIRDLQLGDIVVSDRGKYSWQGHIYFFCNFQDLNDYFIDGLGGNQSDGVNISNQKINKFELGLRFLGTNIT